MASSTQVLQTAIQTARAGQKVQARDLLIELVDQDPCNEMAWMWLTGLVDSLEDRIIACENVLTINPANEKVRAYLADLQRQYAPVLGAKNCEEAAALLDQARACAERKETDSALQLALQSVAKREDCEDAWLLIARLSPDIDQQVAALEKAARLDPANPRTALALKQARYVRAHPLDAATRLEEAGKWDEAIRAYEVQAAVARNLRDFDNVQRRINHIKRLQAEKIRHVSPASSIARLAFGWPLLYLSLALVQMGLNPLKYPNFYLWLGLPLVMAGGYLLSLAEVRSHHVVWEKLFHEFGEGSPQARSLTAATGWFLVLVPHLLLILDSLNRLRTFTAAIG